MRPRRDRERTIRPGRKFCQVTANLQIMRGDRSRIVEDRAQQRQAVHFAALAGHRCLLALRKPLALRRLIRDETGRWSRTADKPGETLRASVWPHCGKALRALDRPRWPIPHRLVWPQDRR